MNKLAIVYWSGTGNTEVMANCIAEGAKEAGAEVTLMGPADFSTARLSEFNVVAFGCPAMGAEVLEEMEFDPMFSGIESFLNGKRIALFGSYGWGDGQWMRDWEERMKAAGAEVACGEGVITQETPDDDALAKCKELGKTLAAV